MRTMRGGVCRQYVFLYRQGILLYMQLFYKLNYERICLINTHYPIELKEKNLPRYLT